MKDLADDRILALFKDAPEGCTHYDYFEFTKITPACYTKVTKNNYYYWSYGTDWSELSAEEASDLNLIKRPKPLIKDKIC